MASGSSGRPPTAALDPVLRNALRYTVSAREYALLHKYVLSRSRALRRRAPSVEAVGRYMDGAPPAAEQARRGPEAAGADDYNARAVRHALRVFVASSVALKLWGLATARLTGKKHDSAGQTPGARRKTKGGLAPAPAVRLSLSLSAILLLYRLLFRFLARLRAQLLDPAAAPFRRRNPRAAGALTSPYAPAVGASLAGLALGAYPARQLRVSVAIYMLFRALEFGWNAAEDSGAVWGWTRHGRAKRERPWWFGSWMLQPLAFGQLLHATVFDRECVPPAVSNFILKWSAGYLAERPDEYPPGLPWPGPSQIVDSLAQMARLNWPPFISPTLFPHKEEILPPSLAAIEPVASPAHPLIQSLSCATLHPSDPSCSRAFLTFWLRSFPPFARLSLVLYSALLLPRLAGLYHRPLSTLNALAAAALRMAASLTGSLATAWGGLCLLQGWLPRALLPTQRLFLGGFLAGLWGLAADPGGGRGVSLYAARASLDSLWKVGAKRRWWRGMKGGDVWLFVAAVAVTGAVYERDARAVREQGWRKGISWVRGEGWRDWAVEEEDGDGDLVGEAEGAGYE